MSASLGHLSNNLLIMGAVKLIQENFKPVHLRINPADYRNHPKYSPISAFSRVVVPVHEVDPIQIDAMRLMLCFDEVRSKDFKYYFYVLGKLVRNDIPISVPLKEIRDFTKDNNTSVSFHGLERLCKEGLLFKVDKMVSCYIVNPVYAWKGNQMDYLDIDSFPLVTMP